MASAFNTQSLQELQSKDEAQVMNIVDRLRRIGLAQVLQLPQLVVCGDQSSGKSSVLEALTEINFPRQENMCTRFATEIVLRRAAEESIVTNITPDKSRPAQEVEKLKKFSKTITNLDDVPELINEALNLMGLNDSEDSGLVRAFSKDILKLEISGPSRPQLTLVDLPGLIHSGNRQQSETDVELIHGLVGEYITNPRTIILAVVSAKNDYANQIILKKCRDVDPKGSRTLGVITKPDFLRPASDNEATWIDLARNQDIYFELGWHMLKNRGDNESCSFEGRNSLEQTFFSQGAYAKKLQESSLGIKTLRERLSGVLSNHLKKELPGLRKELEDCLSKVRHNLSQLGEKRDSVGAQRSYLTKMGSHGSNVVKAAVDGRYDLDFFGKADEKCKVAGAYIQCLRAVVHNLNTDFARHMRLYGMTYKIGKPPGEQDDPDDEDENRFEPPILSNDLSKRDKITGKDTASRVLDKLYDLSTTVSEAWPQTLSRESAVDWAKSILMSTRGRELPGNFNPMLIGQLFAQQSKNWRKITEAHIDRISDVCVRFVHLMLQHVAPEDVRRRLLDLKVHDTMRSALEAARMELQRVIEDKASHPTTYNHYYTTTIQKNRQKKFKQRLDKAIQDAQANGNQGQFGRQNVDTSSVDPAKLRDSVGKVWQLDMDRFSAEDALDDQSAYYKGELKYFIEVVTKQMIERRMIRDLPDTVLSPSLIANLTDEEVEYLATEPSETVRQRSFLENRKNLLEEGQKVFKKTTGSLR